MTLMLDRRAPHAGAPRTLSNGLVGVANHMGPIETPAKIVLHLRAFGCPYVTA